MINRPVKSHIWERKYLKWLFSIKSGLLLLLLLIITSIYGTFIDNWEVANKFIYASLRHNPHINP